MDFDHKTSVVQKKKRGRKMVSTSKRISKAATALLTFAALGGSSAQSKTRNLSNNAKRHRQRHYETETNTARKMTVEDVPLDVRESIDPTLIDYVVAGFPKCGTTYLQNKIIYPSERLFIPHHETHFLANDKYDEFIEEFANVTQLQQESSKPLLSGYKAPFELGHSRAIANLATLFPDVRMIITLRHPVLQFQSLYNYKLRKLPELIPPVEEYVGFCSEQCDASSASSSSSEAVETIVAKKSSQKCLTGVTFCTGETNYQQYLSRLGLTPMNTPEELDLLDHHKMSIHPFAGWQIESNDTTNDESQQSHLRSSSSEGSHRNGRLFLIEIGQFDNRANQSMAEDVRADLESFLGLDEFDLGRPKPRNGDKKPPTVYDYPEGREEHKLDICLEKWTPLREVLLESSRKASKWILEYLLHPSNRDVVKVSNMDIFTRMIEDWKIDPCANEAESAD